MVIAWSYGGGVQSAAIGVLIREGALPVPDLAGIADTGREVATTWEYLQGHMQPYLDAISLKIEVVPHTLARVDLYGPDGLTLVPAYTRRRDPYVGLFGEDYVATEGRKAAYCSGEWKRDVMERWLRSKGVEDCDQWIGYSTDEAWRVKQAHRRWCRPAHPLIEKGISRAMCERLIAAAGLPVPRKSRCWMCPHQTNSEWLEVRSRPQEWEAAVRLEQEINARDPQQAGLFLHPARVPLGMIDLASASAPAGPPRPCETGHCWT